MIFFGQDSLLSSVEKFYDKHIVMMCLIEAEPFGCVRLGDALLHNHMQCSQVFTLKEITTFHRNQGKEENVVKNAKCCRSKEK